MGVKIVNSIALLFLFLGFYYVLFTTHIFVGNLIMVPSALVLAYNCPKVTT